MFRVAWHRLSFEADKSYKKKKKNRSHLTSKGNVSKIPQLFKKKKKKISPKKRLKCVKIDMIILSTD